jgi:hypothetical protein
VAEIKAIMLGRLGSQGDCRVLAKGPLGSGCLSSFQSRATITVVWQSLNMEVEKPSIPVLRRIIGSRSMSMTIQLSGGLGGVACGSCGLNTRISNRDWVM